MSDFADAFRAGMRRLTGHVCLVTSRHANGDRTGMTATAVCSVSAEPPTLLCCLNQDTGTHAAVLSSGAFAINVLGLADRALSDRFAGPLSGEIRFAEGDWQEGNTGMPILASALAVFECRLTQQVASGSHGVFIGEIVRIHADGASEYSAPLLYAHGQYGTFGVSLAPAHVDVPPEAGG